MRPPFRSACKHVSRIHVRVHVGAETYSLPIGNVRAIAELGDVAPLPGAPAAVLGVLHLHGRVLPVIGLAGLLGVPDEGRPLRIVIAEDGGRVAGLAVDAVTGVDVLPETSEDVDSPHLDGAALVDGVLVGAIDVAAVFDTVQHGRTR
jgi:purine-binding chemotaxis protein CheW